MDRKEPQPSKIQPTSPEKPPDPIENLFNAYLTYRDNFMPTLKETKRNSAASENIQRAARKFGFSKAILDARLYPNMTAQQYHELAQRFLDEDREALSMWYHDATGLIEIGNISNQRMCGVVKPLLFPEKE